MSPNGRIDALETYQLANRMFPDDEDLAMFNLLFEIRSGLAVPIGADAPEGGRLHAVIGYVDLGTEFTIQRTYCAPEDPDAALDDLQRRVMELPFETEDEEAELPNVSAEPTVLAAIASWRMPDGATIYVPYRHPDMPAHRAYAILKDVVAEIAAAKLGAADADHGNN